MARPKNYEALIKAKEEVIAKAKEKVATLEKELDAIKKEQKEAEVAELYDAMKKAGHSVSDVMKLLSEKK